MKINAFKLTFIALSAIAVAPLATAATLFSGLYSFGDSLSDVGNTSAATSGTLPGPLYYNGRYSNGPVWVERLASRLGLPAPASLYAGGHDYAFAGAYTAGGGLVPTLQQQADGFIGGGGTFLPTDLVTVWGGANDFFGGQTDPTVPVAKLAGVITTLASGGAKNILLLNLPDFGDLPETLALGEPAVTGSRMFSIGFNLSLAATVPTLESNLGVEIFLLDMFAIGKGLQANAAALGFTNTTEGALTSGNVANADEFLYWDGVHPTARVHSIFGDKAYEAIPEPSAVMLLWVFGAGLLARRNR
jgi:outer membrane lipase/esterase